MSTLSASFRNISDQNCMTLMTVKHRIFLQPKGRNSKINDLIWPVFDLIRDFIDVLLRA